MEIKHHTLEEIVTKLRQVEVLVGLGMARIDRPSDTSLGAEKTKNDWSPI